MYVLDTNTLIYYFKGQGKMAENIANVSPHKIGISTIVLRNSRSTPSYSYHPQCQGIFQGMGTRDRRLVLTIFYQLKLALLIFFSYSALCLLPSGMITSFS
jgi:hypothetical protein